MLQDILLQKDADAVDLFVGSEGTLGIFTKDKIKNTSACLRKLYRQYSFLRMKSRCFKIY
jgi:hypothetical protein